MLHIIDNISRYGCQINYDGSAGENFGKLKIKDNTKLTNKEKDTMNFDISCRISEEDNVDHIHLRFIIRTTGDGYQNTVMKQIL